MVDRRALLQTSAAGAALAWLGCGPKPVAAPPPPPPRLDPEQLRATLRDAVARLCGVYAHASALAVVRTHVAAAVDSGGRGSRRDGAAVVVLSARQASGTRVERVARVVTAAAIDAEVAALIGRRRGRRTVDLGTPVDLPPPPDVRFDAVAQVAALAGRAEAVGSSRLVYRGAYAEIDSADVLVVAPGCDRRQRRLYSRAGVVVAAWRGADLVTGEAATAAAGPLDTGGITDAALGLAAAHALELVTPGTSPAGPGPVLLDPGIVGRLAEVAVAELMTAGAWQRGAAAARARGQAIGAPMVTISDDPTTSPAAYGFDDEGRPSAPAVLIMGGVVGTPLADQAGAAALGVPVTAHARRPGGGGPIEARPCHVMVAPGALGREAMIGGVDDGLLLEGASSVHVDPESWQVVVRAARARRVRGGALTGHVHADLELRAAVPELLGSVTAVSAEVATAARRDHVDGGALWRASTAPWWLARAVVSPARSGG